MVTTNSLAGGGPLVVRPNLTLDPTLRLPRLVPGVVPWPRPWTTASRSAGTCWA